MALFYVKEGTMNDYALKFPVPVPGNMSQMEFTWQNLRFQQPLSYKIEASTDNPKAMAPPKLDIPLTGKVFRWIILGNVFFFTSFFLVLSFVVLSIWRTKARRPNAARYS